MTEVQSNAGVGRPLPVPTIEELPPLVARSPLATIDEAVTFLRINPGLFFGLSAIILLPLQLIVLVLPGSSLRGNRPDRTVDILINSLDQPSAVANGFGTLVFESLAGFAVAVTYGQIASAWYSQQSLSPKQLLVASAKRIPLMTATWVVTHVFIVVSGLVSLGLLGVLVGVFFMVVAPVIGAEAVGLGDSLRRSRELTTSKLGQSLLVYISVAAAGQVIDLSIRFAPTFILGQFNVPIWIGESVFDVVASIIVISFTAATSVILYIDLRVRHEGIDLYMALSDSFSADNRRGRGGQWR